MRVDRGHFFSALAGLIAGVLLIGALPGLASNGDTMYVGQKNNALRATKLISRDGLLLQVGKAGNPALTIDVVGNTPPMAVNSTGKVTHLNADLLDDRSSNQLKSLWWGCSNDYVPDYQDWTCSKTITLPRPGALLLSGSVDLYNASGTPDTVRCRFSIDGLTVTASERYLGLDNIVGEDICTTDAWKQVAAGTYLVEFIVSGVGTGTDLGQGAFWILYVPD